MGSLKQVTLDMGIEITSKRGLAETNCFQDSVSTIEGRAAEIEQISWSKTKAYQGIRIFKENRWGTCYSCISNSNAWIAQLLYYLQCSLLLLSRFSRVWFCNPMDYSPPDFSVHGIILAGCWRGFLQGIFPTQGLNPRLLCFLHWQVVLYP